MTEFPSSMPPSYGRAFGANEIAEHARIVQRRGQKLAHAELCSADARVCVVADDRPGLLALVTDALLMHGLSVQSAQVFCRPLADGRREAVDFFQLRPAKHAEADLELGPAELGEFEQTLAELIAEEVLAASRPSSPPSSGGAATRVYFDLDGLRRSEITLLVEAPDSDGLLNAITSTLHAHGLRIVASDIRTDGGVARDRFELTSEDSDPLTAVRLCDIQQAVHAALPSTSKA
jgi:[protein-PII] uridylyltransferase